MAGELRFPDAEKVMKALLTPIAHAVTVFDPSFTLPIFLVRCVGGSNDGITYRPRVRVEALAETREQAWDLSREADELILAHSGKRIGGPAPAGIVLDKAINDTGPQEVRERNPDQRNVPQVYRLAFRKTRNA